MHHPIQCERATQARCLINEIVLMAYRNEGKSAYFQFMQDR